MSEESKDDSKDMDELDVIDAPNNTQMRRLSHTPAFLRRSQTERKIKFSEGFQEGFKCSEQFRKDFKKWGFAGIEKR